MLTKVKSFGLIGIEGYLVDVEVDITRGLPAYDIVGLADTAIKESRHRVKGAIRNSGFQFPIDNVTINLAPADTKKEGSYYDVAIACGILACTEEVKREIVEGYAFLGELSLDGSLKKINGILPMMIAARKLNISKLIIPKENENEASYIEGIDVYAIKDLKELVGFLNGENEVEKIQLKSFEVLAENRVVENDFKLIKGQFAAKRALEIAAAGGHNIIMVGPPGSGKSMLAKSFSSILPDMTFEEALEVTKIHSIAGELDSKAGIIVDRPFRSPHHTATTVALTGGGRNSKPGEISLAHNGVLFLDEFPEYSRQSVETLRQPLEDGSITVSRVQQTVEYPASITLVASMNPCPCGYYGSKNNECRCSPNTIQKYISKISGPIMDRIDLHVEIDGVEFEDLTSYEEAESSASIKKRVDAARSLQRERYAGSNTRCNSEMNASQLKKYCELDDETTKILKRAFDRFKLSARAYTRILKVARTIADLEHSDKIKKEHITEAIQYRSYDLNV